MSSTPDLGPPPQRITVAVPQVRRLIEEQFPQWAGLPVQPVASGGWDNWTFRLGTGMLVRLPSAAEYALAVDKEHRWLPALAPQLPLPIPVPLAKGEPGADYPYSWSVYPWLDGEPASADRIADPVRFAADLAGFLTALRSADPAGGPRPGKHNWFRGGPLRTYDGAAQSALTALDGRIDVGLAHRIWQVALDARGEGAESWFHGDVAEGNLLLSDGRLAAVIDFGTCGVGDPACDEDALQETLIRAWRALPGFEGRSTLRAWLYKIATNAALDVAKRRYRRELPVAYGPPATAGGGPGAPLAETTWVEPYPDRALGASGSPASPEARYDQRESLELAFVAALQTLPAPQRAVLLLREVLGFSAAEIADQLGTSVPAVTSALQRAREGVRRRNGEPAQRQALRALGDKRVRRLVEAFVDALERADVASLADLLTEDATWAMPPLPGWYRGPAAVAEFLASFGFNERWRHRPSEANGQLALGCYTVDPATGAWVASALTVLSVRGERIAGADYFLTAELLRRWGDDAAVDGAEMFARFGLPATIQ